MPIKLVLSYPWTVVRAQANSKSSKLLQLLHSQNSFAPFLWHWLLWNYWSQPQRVHKLRILIAHIIHVKFVVPWSLNRGRSRVIEDQQYPFSVHSVYSPVWQDNIHTLSRTTNYQWSRLISSKKNIKHFDIGFSQSWSPRDFSFLWRTRFDKLEHTICWLIQWTTYTSNKNW